MVAGATDARLTVVAGEPGIGKTTFVDAATRATDTLWITLDEHSHAIDLAALLLRRLRSRHRSISAELITAVSGSGGPTNAANSLARAEQLGVLISEELDRSLDRPLTLVIDELERIDHEVGSMRLIESLVRSAPPALSLVLITRTQLGFEINRLRANGGVRDVRDGDLRLPAPDIEQLVLDVLPEPAAVAAAAVAALARGNPGVARALAAVVRRLVDSADAVPERWRAFIERARESPDPIATSAEVLIELVDERERDVLEEIAVHPTLSRSELAGSAGDDSTARLDRLVDDGLIRTIPGQSGVYRCTRAASAVMHREPERLGHRVLAAVQRAIERGDPRGALLASMLGDAALIEQTLTAHGSAVIADGSAQLVLDAIEALPAERQVMRAGLAGRAHQALGNWQTALAMYESASPDELLAADIWRHGLIHYLQGDAAAALTVYDVSLRRATSGNHDQSAEAGATSGDDGAAERAIVAGYAGAAAWIVGDLDRARQLARAALTLATNSGADAALSVAHTAAALVAASDGDRMTNDWHYVQALEHAERAGDALQVARIRTNQGSRLLEEAEFADALAELDLAVRFATIGGYGAVLALALTNRGEVLTKLGRLDEARADLMTAVEVLQRQRSSLVAYPMAELGRLFVMRGDIEQARSACEEAMRRSSDADRQIVVMLRVHYARALADANPAAATRLAEEAANEAPQSLDASELLALLSELHRRLGRPDQARAAADRGMELARVRRDRYALALCLEAAALVDGTRDDRRSQLEEAHSLLAELGCVLDAARVDLRRIELEAEWTGADAGHESDVRIESILELAGRTGARPLRAAAERLLERRRSSAAPSLAVTVLGTFRVAIDGDPIPANAWQSRRARTLFKVLAARRRPILRDQALELLWPDDDGGRATKKLSVALATIRSVLDPTHRFASDHYLIADEESIRLDPANVAIDVDRFLSLGLAALDEYRRRSGPVSTEMLAAAEALYTGDLLEDEPYVDWYVTAREEARACYLSVTRELAGARADAGRNDDACRLYMRMLEREPYDEHAHLRLVQQLSAAGRHGEARRGYQRYADAMRELGIEPRAFPGR